MSVQHRLPQGAMGLLGACCALSIAALLWLTCDTLPAVDGPPRTRLATLADVLLGPAANDTVNPDPSAALLRASEALVGIRHASGLGSAEAAVLEAPPRNDNPERLAAEAWRAAEHGDLISAQAQLDAVLRQHPDFRPALTLRGLLAAGWRLPRRAPDPAARDSASGGPTLPAAVPPADLGEEAALRLAAQRGPAAPAGWLPANLIQLAPGVQTVLAADVSQARLYLLQRTGQGFQVSQDLYLSTGARGSHKQMPGDKRTPIGVYSLGHRLPGNQLPPLAGDGAWPLQFPNRWDQWQGHLGSGIWLHGSAPGQHDGLPHSTNGCLAVSNQDLRALADTLSAPGTVLLVADQLTWISPEVQAARRADALTRLHLEPALHDGATVPSIYAYPGEQDLLLVRTGEGGAGVQERFWPSGAHEPLRSARN